jgi:hypothetical protein
MDHEVPILIPQRHQSRWTLRRSRARRSGRRPRLTHDRPWVIREPESGWWDAYPEPGPATLTVAVVGESETRWGAGPVVARLAELAVNDELVVVYGPRGRSGTSHLALVDGLRERLPRHHVVGMRAGQHGAGLGRGEALLLDEFLDNGSLPVVVTPPSALYDVTAEVSSCLRADRVLRVYRTADGVDAHQVWRRHATASAG